MKYIIPLNLIGELIIINILLLTVSLHPQGLIESDILIFSNVSWFLCTFFTKHYYIKHYSGILTSLLNLSTLLIFYLLVFYAFLGFLHKNEFPDNLFLYYSFWLFLLLLIWRITVFFVLLKWLVQQSTNKKNIVIVGVSTNSVYFQEFIKKHPEYGYVVLGFFHNKPNTSEQNILGDFSEVEKFVFENNVNEIICSLEKVDKNTLDSIIKFAENNLINLKFIPDSTSSLGYNFLISYLELFPLLQIHKNPLEELNNYYLKRAFDFCFSLIVFTFILSWLIPIIALIIIIDSRGSAFFIQKRSGLKNKSFKCFKFRTMRVNKDAHLLQASKDDPRLTKIGKFLRKTSLDELPQFFNVLLGSMSVVGPRPHMLKHTEEYSQKVDKYMLRHTVKPGITGLSQIMGYRGETKELYQMKMRARVDRFYIENWTFYLDLKIIFYTILSMLKKDNNAY